MRLGADLTLSGQVELAADLLDALELEDVTTTLGSVARRSATRRLTGEAARARRCRYGRVVTASSSAFGRRALYCGGLTK
jgi:hypothetical protein